MADFNISASTLSLSVDTGTLTIASSQQQYEQVFASFTVGPVVSLALVNAGVLQVLGSSPSYLEVRPSRDAGPTIALFTEGGQTATLPTSGQIWPSGLFRQ
jgi:hypothetical protein